MKRLWVHFRQSLLALGQIMGRRSVISKVPSQTNTSLLGLCLLMLLPTLACVSASLWRERKAAQAAHILVPIQDQHWNEVPPEDDLNAVEKVFKLTTRFSEQDLARAYYMHANVLYLGQIQGRYRVYVDGELTTWGSSSEATHPVTISFPVGRLQAGEPLSIVIEVSRTQQDLKADVHGRKAGEGFVTPEIADDLIQARQWETELEPLICATAFGVLGSLFFFGWVTQRRKQEYAYFAAFAFLQSWMHVCGIDFVQQMIGVHWMSLGRLSFLVWEGTLAMLLGFALARTRSSWMIAVVAITTALSLIPFAASWMPFSIGSLASWQKYLFKAFVPLAYARGGVACLIQWNVLSQHRHRQMIASNYPVTDTRVIPCIMRRSRDLRRMGLALILIGALFALQATLYSMSDGAMGLFRLSHFLILLACYGVGEIEERRQGSQERVTQAPQQGAQDIRKVS